MTRVAFQGELGAYSELATYEYFGTEVTVVPQETFEGIFTAVSTGAADHGVIPIENSLAGSIHENYDLLLEHDLVITGEIKLRISHMLLANQGVALDDIRRVYSHPQALSQCKQYLRSLEGVELVSVSDTAGAAKLVRDSGSTTDAAVASAQAARDYGLSVIAEEIESNHLNFTRFLILSKELDPPTSDAKTSIVFSTRNIPGALFKSLSVFALRDIDLYKIESRPLPGSPWVYIFYLDFNGDIRDEVTIKAIGHLEEIANMLKVLGSYPKGREVTGQIQPREE